MRLVHLLVDEVVVEDCIDVDISQFPHQFAGMCQHGNDCSYINIKDSERIEKSLDLE